MIDVVKLLSQLTQFKKIANFFSSMQSFENKFLKLKDIFTYC